MGYRSEVRIRLTKEDYEKLSKEFEQKIAPKTGYNLFDKEHLDAYKEVKNIHCWKDTDDGEDIEETHDCIFFGWNYVKWYDGYDDVDFIMDFMYNCEHYAFCRIGESLEGDIELHDKNMEMIGFYYAFDDEDDSGQKSFVTI